MAGFGLGKGGVIKDSSFVYIEWEGKDSPKHNAAIKDLIEDLDEEHFLDTGTMEDSLPYLTFLQAEVLFRALRILLLLRSLWRITKAASPLLKMNPVSALF